MPGNETALARLLDEAAVRDVTARFAESIMAQDHDTFRSLWAEDGEWVIGATEGQPFERRATGPDDIVSMLKQLWEGNDYFVHFAVQSVIEITGDQAAARCMCHEAARGPRRHYRTNGVWSDQLRRQGDRWVFTRRAYRYLWLDMLPFTGDTFPFPHSNT